MLHIERSQKKDERLITAICLDICHTIIRQIF
ncbi:MAG: hypothetical protein JWR12_877 [Mucilaginibacter sp.]|nr:hypothetical protein [Mucilaginibacter sp.]